MEVNYQKDWKVTRGPFLLFDGSFVLEFLEPDEELDATTLVRATYKANHPLLRKGKSHPQAPPLHIHWDQFETFKVLQGTVALTMGYEQKEIVLTPDNTPFKIPPMVPHLPYPHPELTGKGEDTVALLWAHPTNIPNPMDDMFFEHLFRYLDKCQNEKKSLDFLQVALSQSVDPGWLPKMMEEY